MEKTYSEKLKDPRWQKKRLQIMKRDKFMCRECGDDKSTLNVHHLIYHSNMAPWEYANDELKTLCEGCHSTIYDYFQTIKIVASSFNGETMRYAVDILRKMTFLYPPDCEDLLELATELAKINNTKNG